MASHSDLNFYLHPHLFPDHDPVKGRLLRASAPVKAGTLLFIDAPYALVPITCPSRADPIICSNRSCSRLVVQDGKESPCPRNCTKDVVWCNESCRSTDSNRHDYECRWLSQNAENIRQKERQYDFGTLWHVVRLLAGWYLETQNGSSTKAPTSSSDNKYQRNWQAVESCCAYLSSWPKSQLEHWKRLIQLYLNDASGLPTLPSQDEILSLLCKEETNTFGLYAEMTGPMHMMERSRGECYGFSLFPRAAIFNHSCEPNVGHMYHSHIYSGKGTNPVRR